jgi:hypothetical protein
VLRYARLEQARDTTSDQRFTSFSLLSHSLSHQVSFGLHQQADVLNITHWDCSTCSLRSMRGERSEPIPNLGVTGSNPVGDANQIKDIRDRHRRTFAPFYNFARHVLQTRLCFVLCSSRLARRLPLQYGRRRELFLVHLARVMHNHATRLAGDRRNFRVGASRFEQEHHR